MADSEYKRGVKEFTLPPLNSLLPPETIALFKNCYELSNHPKAMEAINIINLLKAAKQRMMNLLVHPNCEVEAHPGSEMLRVYESAQRKIRCDEELAYVFESLDELGLYVNPVK